MYALPNHGQLLMSDLSLHRIPAPEHPGFDQAIRIARTLAGSVGHRGRPCTASESRSVRTHFRDKRLVLTHLEHDLESDQPAPRYFLSGRVPDLRLAEVLRVFVGLHPRWRSRIDPICLRLEAATSCDRTPTGLDPEVYAACSPARILWIEQCLFDSGYLPAARALSSHGLAVCIRTIRRDLDRLGQLGWSILPHPSGGHYLAEPFRPGLAVRLTPLEAILVDWIIGTASSSGFIDGLAAPKMRHHVTLLSPLLGQAQRIRTDPFLRIPSSVVVPPPSGAGAEILALALLQGCRVRLTVRKQGGIAWGNREVQPVAFAWEPTGWMLETVECWGMQGSRIRFADLESVEVCPPPLTNALVEPWASFEA